MIRNRIIEDHDDMLFLSYSLRRILEMLTLVDATAIAGRGPPAPTAT